ncbi:MAG: hypothetical protein LBB73_04610 [Dysgonamonadaceae bacterium]|jgi:hypothetical protein|nr:hypothetical protein [Dysgonamonadaceae bacterium]
MKGRSPDKRIPPFQGLVNVVRSVRRALPCAIDYRAFSPPVWLMTGYDTGFAGLQLSIITFRDKKANGGR